MGVIENKIAIKKLKESGAGSKRLPIYVDLDVLTDLVDEGKAYMEPVGDLPGIMVILTQGSGVESALFYDEEHTSPITASDLLSQYDNIMLTASILGDEEPITSKMLLLSIVGDSTACNMAFYMSSRT